MTPPSNPRPTPTPPAPAHAGQAVTLAPTPALARQLREAEALRRQQAGERVWEAPQIFPVDLWARRLWLRAWPEQQQLHPVQELVLCEQLTAAQGAQVLSSTELARSLRQALAICDQQDIDLAQAPESTTEQQQLRGWREELATMLARFGGLTNAQVEPALTRLIAAGQVRPPAHIRVAGEPADLSRAQRQLLAACVAAGARVEYADPRGPATGTAACEGRLYANETALWSGVATLVREALRAAPEARVLIVVDNAETLRPALEAALQEALCPQLMLEGSRQRPWRFAAGRRLSEYPLVSAALSLLRWSRQTDDPDSVFALLHNPVLLGGERALDAARAERRLRREGGDVMPLARVLGALAPGPAAEALQAFAEVLQQAPREALPSAWVAHLDARLAAFGWPNVAGTLPPELHQEVEQWREACATFQALDAQTGPISPAQAARYLRETVATRRFTPRAEIDVPVEIVDLDGARGLRADLIIAAGLYESNFPRPVRRNPFIAQSVLVASELPYSSPEDCNLRAQRFLEDSARNGRRLVYACAAQSDAGSELEPSPLLRRALGGPLQPAQPGDTAIQRWVGAATLSASQEEPTPVTPAELRGGYVRGGARLLESVAESPLYALVAHRLGAQGLDPVSRMSPATQGRLTHRVMERLSRRWASRDALRAAEAQWEDAIAQAVDQALEELTQATRYRPATLQLERGYQIGVARAALGHEVRRAHNYSVLGRELRIEDIEFHGLPLRLSIDRIDRVHTPLGPRDLLIDYKTSTQMSIGGWEAEALREPQLPLYGSDTVLAGVNAALARQAAASGEPAPAPVGCDGLCFFVVHPEKPAFKALTNWTPKLLEDGSAGGSREERDWPGRRQRWQQRLESMTAAFLAGDLRFDAPSSKAETFAADLLAVLTAGHRERAGDPGDGGDGSDDAGAGEAP